MRQLRTQAIVLRRTNYGEADRIVQLLTPHGRHAVMARGVRKEKSKLAGGIELFALSDVVIGQGKGELGVVTSARLGIFYGHILQEYDRLQFGYEVLKQVAKASEMVDEPEWFDILIEVLAGLNTLTIPLSLIETWYYLRQSALLGYELGLRYDVEGVPLRQADRYYYDVSEKGFRRRDNGDITADHIKFLRLVATKPLQTLVQIGGLDAVLSDCRAVVRAHAE